MNDREKRGMEATCSCCGQEYDRLTDLMDHMRKQHTADEVMAALRCSDQSQSCEAPGADSSPTEMNLRH